MISSFYGVPNILFVGAPLKIRHIVICSITINVIYLGIIIRVGNKSLCDKPMYTHGFICVSST